jgi:putative intracellular protease/amidase
MRKNIYIFLFDAYADWEISFLAPELNKSEHFELIYFAKSHEAVRSMGGLIVKPMKSLAEVNFEDIDMLILPGGNAWERDENMEIKELTTAVFNAGKPVATICAGTVFLARLGFLNHLKHTSNDPGYLKALSPGYSGEQHYQEALAFTDQNLITAKGIAPIEFAREVFKTLELYNDEQLEKWFQLFKNGIWTY